MNSKMVWVAFDLIILLILHPLYAFLIWWNYSSFSTSLLKFYLEKRGTTFYILSMKDIEDISLSNRTKIMLYGHENLFKENKMILKSSIRINKTGRFSTDNEVNSWLELKIFPPLRCAPPSVRSLFSINVICTTRVAR